MLREAIEKCRWDVKLAMSLRRLYENFQSTGKLQMSDVLFASTVYCSSSSGYHYKAAQIDRFDWLDDFQVQRALAFLRSVGVGDASASFEVDLSKELDDRIVVGRADVITPSTLYELKCTAGFKKEHLVQLAFYAWLVTTSDVNDPGTPQMRKARLVYVSSGEVYELHMDAPAIERLVQYVLAVKASPPHPQLDDAQFVELASGCG